MIIQKAYIFNRHLYDGMKASTIGGLRANQIKVYSSTFANNVQSENVFIPSHWDQLHSYDLVIWGEEEITQVDQLPGLPRTGQILVMIDGGEAKAGDLVGIWVYKFRLSNEVCLLAYRILDEDSIKLLTFGPHENFYRDLKRQEN